MPPEGKSPCLKGVGEPPNRQHPDSSPRLSAIQIPHVPNSSVPSVPLSAKPSKQQKHNKIQTKQKQVSFSLEPEQAISIIEIPLPSPTHHSPVYHTLRVLWDSGAHSSFIDSSLAKHPSLLSLSQPLAVPCSLKMFDGQPSSGGWSHHSLHLSSSHTSN